MPSDLRLDPDTQFVPGRQRQVVEPSSAEQIWAEQSRRERSRAERRRAAQVKSAQVEAVQHQAVQHHAVQHQAGQHQAGQTAAKQLPVKQVLTEVIRPIQIRAGHGGPGQAVTRTSRRRRRSLIAMALSLAVVGTAGLSMSSATATPKPTVKEVQRKVDKLKDQAEQATEDYNQTQVQLKSLKIRLKATKAQLARQNVELAKSRQQLGKLASETYRRGELSTLDLVLGDDPDLALAQAGYLPMLSDRQADATNRLRLGQEKLANTQAAMKSQQARAAAAQVKLRKTKKTVNKKLAEAEYQVNLLQGADREALSRSENQAASAGVPAGAGIAFCNAKADAAPSANARTALRYACSKLGDAYLWAGTGPTRFDCSGLTMRAYGAAGVSLPHSSRSQANAGTRVSISALQPGDLVFFGSPIHHVGIVLGDGLMVHAPKSGDVVRIASLYRTPSAAVRL